MAKVENSKPVGWFLVLDHNGIFEGVFARFFPNPAIAPIRIARNADDEMLRGSASFIRDMKRDGLKYENGNVLDPRNGKIYKAKMTVSPDGQTLTMRGYLGISLFGKDGDLDAATGFIAGRTRSDRRRKISARAGRRSETGPDETGSCGSEEERRSRDGARTLIQTAGLARWPWRLGREGGDRRHRLRDHFRHGGIELQHRGRSRQRSVRHRSVAFGARMHRAAINRRRIPQVAS